MSTGDAKATRQLRLGPAVEPALEDQLDSSADQLGQLPTEGPLDPLRTAVRARDESRALISAAADDPKTAET
jgi:hypothetical protein